VSFLLLDLKQDRVILESSRSLSDFLKSPTYKIRMRRFVSKHSDNEIIFNDNLSIHEIIKLKDLITQHSSSLIVSDSLKNYITNKSFHIESRQKVGNDIKRKHPNLYTQYREFKQTIDLLMKRQLTVEQSWNAFYMYVMKNSSNFSVPGSGKTATVLGTYIYLKNKNDINKIVMIGPKNSFGSWIDEYKECFNTVDDDFYLNIHDSKYTNTRNKKRALEYESGHKNLILINYESVDSYVPELKTIIDSKTLLVLDEAHKIKNPIGQRANAVKKICSDAHSIIALTGTPIPNSYVDIYNLLNILYPHDYKHFFGFSIPQLRNPSELETEMINNKIKPFFCRISKEQLGVPAPNDDFILNSDVSSDENQLFKILYQKYRKNLFALFIRIMQLESDPKQLLKSLNPEEFKYLVDDESDLALDVEVVDYSQEIITLIKSIKKTTKVQATLELIRSLVAEDKPVIVWCNLTSSIELLKNECNKIGLKANVINGAVPLSERISLIDAFKKREFVILLTNPHTLAESVSLHSVCHDAIYFEYNFNLVHLLQSKDRIHRLGLKDSQYTQYYFMQNTYLYNNENVSIFERVYNILKDKELVMNNAITNDILETLSSNEEDLNLIFKDL